MRCEGIRRFSPHQPWRQCYNSAQFIAGSRALCECRPPHITKLCERCVRMNPVTCKHCGERTVMRIEPVRI